MSTIRVGNIGPLTGNTSTVADPGVSGGGMSLVSMGAVSASGTAVDFTGIPSWARRITVMYQGVSMSGTSNPRIQLGTSGGLVSTGYVGGTSYLGIGVGALSAGFDINSNFGHSGNLFTGHFIITLMGSNTWICSSTVYSTGAGTQPNLLAGYVSLSGTLTQVRVTSVNGSDTFDAGSINVMYE